MLSNEIKSYDEWVMNDGETSCKRPYILHKRRAGSEMKRAAILDAARRLLEKDGSPNLTMGQLARESGISRQTVHNLFRTKFGVLEALFDQMALEGGMGRMQEVMANIMRLTDAGAILEGYVAIFTGFWSKDRLLIRRIHGIGATDPEIGAAVAARNQRRLRSAARVIDRLDELRCAPATRDRARKIATLYSMTSFEFFDVLAESVELNVPETLLSLVRGAVTETS
jgi:AcrR family transcriptional regulator